MEAFKNGDDKQVRGNGEMEIKVTIRDFIKENFMLEENGGFNDSVSFLESGIVDSTGMLEIVEFLEEKFGVALEDDELIPENLDSVENLTKLVGRKLEAGP